MESSLPQLRNLSRIVIVTPRVIPPFASNDATLLSRSFEVDVVPVSGLRTSFRLWRSLSAADAVLIWFLGRNAPLAVVRAQQLGVPIIAVIGGFEVAWVESLRYGIKPGSIKEKVIEWMISRSQCVLSVSEFSRREALSRFPHLAAKFRLIPNSVDTERFSLPTDHNRSGVISVGAIDRETIGRKSWQLFRDVAELMPETRFSIIGRVGDLAGEEFVRRLPANVSWLGALSTSQLVERLQESSVYLQASVHEAFCVSLVEAMSCGCFPVISNLAALPEVVGGVGTVIPALTPDAAAAAVRSALGRSKAERALVRERVVTQYRSETRLGLLNAVFKEILTTSRS